MILWWLKQKTRCWKNLGCQPKFKHIITEKMLNPTTVLYIFIYFFSSAVKTKLTNNLDFKTRLQTKWQSDWEVFFFLVYHLFLITFPPSVIYFYGEFRWFLRPEEGELKHDKFNDLVNRFPIPSINELTSILPSRREQGTLLLYSSTKLPTAKRNLLSGLTLQFILYNVHGASYL